jgi:hypothetical protein
MKKKPKAYRRRTMIEGRTAPLEIARRVLKPETIRQLKRDGFPNSAYLILDRWALNSPDILLAWEAWDSFDLLTRLEQQMSWEKAALNSDTAWEMSRRGMSDWEILSELGVNTELEALKSR